MSRNCLGSNTFNTLPKLHDTDSLRCQCRNNLRAVESNQPVCLTFKTLLHPHSFYVPFRGLGLEGTYLSVVAYLFGTHD